jgi:hypothetical protein
MTAKKTVTVIKMAGKKSARKGEVWRITTGGSVRTVTTRRASIRALDEGAERYSEALQRLAHR